MPTQIVAADFLACRRRAFLWDAPRVGKTPAAIAAADYVMARRIIVATTASGRGVWRKAFAAWQTIPRRVRVVGADLDGPTDVCIVSWGMLDRIANSVLSPVKPWPSSSL